MVNLACAKEPLLADASKSLDSACVIINDLTGMLEGTHCRMLLGIVQVVMLGELVVNQVLDNRLRRICALANVLKWDGFIV